MTPEIVASVAGFAIALLFGYFPALRTWYAAQTSENKSFLMIGLVILTGFGVWGAGCIGWIQTGIACTVNAIPEVLKCIFFALVANQATNRIAPELKDVKEAKAARDKAAGQVDSGEWPGYPG